jgi:hypothetical protein
VIATFGSVSVLACYLPCPRPLTGESSRPAEGSISHTTRPCSGRINWAGRRSGSYGPSTTALSAAALSGP